MHELTRQSRTESVDSLTSALADAQSHAVVLDATRDAWHNRYSREASYAEAGNVLRGKTWDKTVEVLKSFDQIYAREVFTHMDDAALKHLWAALKPEEIYEAENLPSLGDSNEEAEAFLWDELLSKHARTALYCPSSLSTSTMGDIAKDFMFRQTGQRQRTTQGNSSKGDRDDDLSEEWTEEERTEKIAEAIMVLVLDASTEDTGGGIVCIVIPRRMAARSHGVLPISHGAR